LLSQLTNCRASLYLSLSRTSWDLPTAIPGNSTTKTGKAIPEGLYFPPSYHFNSHPSGEQSPSTAPCHHPPPPPPTLPYCCSSMLLADAARMGLLARLLRRWLRSLGSLSMLTRQPDGSCSSSCSLAASNAARCLLSSASTMPAPSD